MKFTTYSKALALIASMLSAGLFAQTAADRQAATEGAATRGSAPMNQTQDVNVKASSGASSDAGLQRVVSKRATKFSGTVGSSFSYFYRSNALSTNGTLGKKIKSGVINISGFASASYGNYEFLNGVLTPYAGVLASKLSHTKSQLDFADTFSQKFYILGDWKYVDGWAVVPSLEFTRIESSKFDTEDYKEWYPNVTVSKTWGIDEKSVVRAYYTTGYHYSEVDDFGGVVAGITDDRLDNWTNTFSLNYYRSFIYDIVGHIYGDLTHKSYSNGQNKNRDDLNKTVGGSLSYSWKILRASAFANYTDRGSDLAVDEYKNLDAGASLSAVLKF